jgi:hypothetical protein
MRLTAKHAWFVVPAALSAAAPAAAQVVAAATGFATISIAGLGNTTTVAGDLRIPILARDVSYDATTTQLHLRATGRRGVVRQLDVDVRGARPGQRYDFGPNTGASLRVRMEQGEELAAESGRGFIQIATMDAQRVTGTYEGTFSHGQVPIVIRGRFEANFPRPRAGAAPPSMGR